VWFDNWFSIRKQPTLHWASTVLFFPIFILVLLKKKLLHFGKQLRVQELLVSSLAISAT